MLRQERIKKVNNIEYLIVSNSFDYTSDYIAIELEKRGASYIRINYDKLHEINYSYSIDDGLYVILDKEDKYFLTKDGLKSVFFRAPVFVRSNKTYSLEAQLRRSQASAFVRNLIVFEKAKWINHPVSVYKSENKLYQLEIASKYGLNIPTTHVANCCLNNIEKNKMYAVKSLDTALFFDGKQEYFTYTTIMAGSELMKASLADAPLIIQDCIEDKIDIRVTYIAGKVFPATITNNGEKIEGDWRKTPKQNLVYSPCDLPEELTKSLVKLMDDLGLNFGGIDLAFSKGEYYFIEVNPTGEWGWLVKTAGFPIAETIVDFMRT